MVFLDHCAQLSGGELSLVRLLAAVHIDAHVILADLFPSQQIPKWADEGMAVLSEPAAEQDRRLADLAGPLSSGRSTRG